MDSSGPKWTRLSSSSTDAVAGRFPTYTVRAVWLFCAESAAVIAAGEYGEAAGEGIVREGRRCWLSDCWERG